MSEAFPCRKCDGRGESKSGVKCARCHGTGWYKSKEKKQ